MTASIVVRMSTCPSGRSRPPAVNLVRNRSSCTRAGITNLVHRIGASSTKPLIAAGQMGACFSSSSVSNGDLGCSNKRKIIYFKKKDKILVFVPTAVSRSTKTCAIASSGSNHNALLAFVIDKKKK